MSNRRRSALLVATVACCSAPRPALAQSDLLKATGTLKSEWKSAGAASTGSLQTRLIERGTLLPVLLPKSTITSRTARCTTVAVVAPRASQFVLRFIPRAGEPRYARGERAEPSVAGIAQIVRCGARRAMLRRLVIEARSPRSVVETVYATSSRPLPSFTKLLPKRSPGLPDTDVVFEPRSTSPPLKDRVARLAARAKRRGAQRVTARNVQVGRFGVSETVLKLTPGCHRIDVLGDPKDGERYDIDVNLKWALTGQSADADRTDAADATVHTCVASTRLAKLTFVGAPTGRVAKLVMSRTRLPRGIPQTLGERAVAAFAETFAAHNSRPPAKPPIAMFKGVSGFTKQHVQLVAGQCYLASAVATRGSASAIALAVRGRFVARDQSKQVGLGTVVAFCARESRRSSILLEARGGGVRWALAVWHAGALPAGALAE